MLDSGAVDLAILFRFNRPSGREERLLSVAHPYLVSAPGDEVTRQPTVNFVSLASLRLVLPAARGNGAVPSTRPRVAWGSSWHRSRKQIH